MTPMSTNRSFETLQVLLSVVAPTAIAGHIWSPKNLQKSIWNEDEVVQDPTSRWCTRWRGFGLKETEAIGTLSVLAFQEDNSLLAASKGWTLKITSKKWLAPEPLLNTPMLSFELLKISLVLWSSVKSIQLLERTKSDFCTEYKKKRVKHTVF